MNTMVLRKASIAKLRTLEAEIATALTELEGLP